jgi:hypothetical protein
MSRAAAARVRSIEVSLADAVNATVCAMGIVEPFAVKLVVSIACGVTWPRLVRTDPRGRREDAGLCQAERALSHVAGIARVAVADAARRSSRGCAN